MKFGVITAWPELETSSYEAGAKELGVTLLFKTIESEQLAKTIQELHDADQVDAAVIMGITPAFAPEQTSIPYSLIRPDRFDVLCALSCLLKLGHAPAVEDIPYITEEDYVSICNLLNIQVSRHRFYKNEHDTGSDDQLKEVISQIAAERRDALATADGRICQIATEMDFPTVPIIPSARSFKEVLSELSKNIQLAQVQKARTIWLRAVFDNSSEGITVLDKDENVVAMNAETLRFMHLTESDVLNRSIYDVKSNNPLFERFLNAADETELLKSRTRAYLVNREVLYSNEKPIGTIIRGRPVKELQTAEMIARKKINEKGLVAAATFDSIKGSSSGFEAIKDMARRFAAVHSNVVIYGESGSGKELFAQSIHNASPHRNGPFVAINCTALPESLLESELFGYDAGTFTGANKNGKAGLFELAHQGTLFMDEIGDMPISLQAKLLRVLQEQKVRRVGGSNYTPIDVRFVFATNRDLGDEVKKGTFRNDLYYRINVLPLRIPPLREHIEDLAEISRSILRQLSKETKKLIELSPDEIKLMQAYDWPGNIRELRNFLERISVYHTLNEGTVTAMIKEMTGSGAVHSETSALVGAEHGDMTVPLDTLHNIENAVIKTLYKEYRWDRKKIESVLEISTSSLYRRLKELALI